MPSKEAARKPEQSGKEAAQPVTTDALSNSDDADDLSRTLTPTQEDRRSPNAGEVFYTPDSGIFRRGINISEHKKKIADGIFEKARVTPKRSSVKASSKEAEGLSEPARPKKGPDQRRRARVSQPDQAGSGDDRGEPELSAATDPYAKILNQTALITRICNSAEAIRDMGHMNAAEDYRAVMGDPLLGQLLRADALRESFNMDTFNLYMRRWPRRDISDGASGSPPWPYWVQVKDTVRPQLERMWDMPPHIPGTKGYVADEYKCDRTAHTTRGCFINLTIRPRGCGYCTRSHQVGTCNAVENWLLADNRVPLIWPPTGGVDVEPAGRRKRNGGGGEKKPEAPASKTRSDAQTPGETSERPAASESPSNKPRTAQPAPSTQPKTSRKAATKGKTPTKSNDMGKAGRTALGLEEEEEEEEEEEDDDDSQPVNTNANTNTPPASTTTEHNTSPSLSPSQSQSQSQQSDTLICTRYIIGKMFVQNPREFEGLDLEDDEDIAAAGVEYMALKLNLDRREANKAGAERRDASTTLRRLYRFTRRMGNNNKYKEAASKVGLRIQESLRSLQTLQNLQVKDTPSEPDLEPKLRNDEVGSESGSGSNTAEEESLLSWVTRTRTRTSPSPSRKRESTGKSTTGSNKRKRK